MASVAELLERIESAENRLRIRERNVEQWQRRLAADPTLEALANERIQENQSRANDIKNEIAQLRSQLIEAQQQEQSQQAEQETVQGQTATEAVSSNEPDNPLQQPPQVVDTAGDVEPAPEATRPSNAVVTPTAETGDVDFGTDAPVRTLQQTQQVNEWSEPGAVPGVTVSDRTQFSDPEIPGVTVRDANQTDPGVVSAGFAPGEGAVANDDNVAPNTDTTQTAVDAEQTNPITINPRGNVLDNFHNYTYSASVYVLTPEQFALYQQQPKKTISGYNLLFQSGGAPTGTGEFRGAAAGQANSGIEDNRNPAFRFDYYIDSIEIDNLILGKATQAAHGVVSVKFTVVEPGNISLLDNIYRAVQDLNPTLSSKTNYAAAIYLMVIRFYGYDLNGRPVRVGAASEDTTQTDPDAVVEKFIPFRIKQIDWSVSNQLVSYKFEGVAVGQIVGAATRRGTIPADIQLSGATVRAMLQGDPLYSAKQAPSATPGASTTAGRPQQTDPGEIPGVTVADRGQSDSGAQAPPKATAAGNKSSSLISGLIGAMNAQQQEKLRRGEIEVADEYVLEFGPDAEQIADATVTKPGKKVAKDYTSGAVPASKGNTSSASPDKQRMDTTSRNFAIPAGTQLLQAIDQIIRNSTYITDQALVVFDEKSNRAVPNPKANKDGGFQWYNILMQATPLEYDNKRNDFAFRIRYVVVPYTPQDFFSTYFPVPRFQGVHKRYPYWFTGENTQVLDYQASFNKLFTITVTGSGSENTLQAFRDKYSTSMRDVPYLQTQARSSESDVGADGRANDLAANAAEYLYNPSDNGRARLRILGDPAWIQQGSASGLVSDTAQVNQPFNADGTINFDSTDILFEIAWQRPEDYDINTGLADPYARTQSSFQDRQPIQSVIYRARKCISYFNQGKFEQELEGTLYWFPLPDGRNLAPGASLSSANNNADESGERVPGGSTGANNKLTTPNDSSGSTYSLLADSAKSLTGSTGLKLPESIPTTLPDLGTGQFNLSGISLPADALPPGLVTSNGITLPTTGSAPGPEPTAAELLASATERNRLTDIANTARQNYERLLAANNNDRSNPEVESAFAAFQAANRAANAALDAPVGSPPVTNNRQLIDRET